MKNILSTILISLLLSSLVYSQCCTDKHSNQIPNIIYSNLSAFTPHSFQSVIETTDGFDNFKLGVDFAEPYIATNPNNPLNSVCAFINNRVYYTIDGINWNNVNAAPGIYGGDPFVCFDGLGTVYYSYLPDNNQGCRISRSSDQGVTWTNHQLYSGYVDKESIIAVQSGGPYSNYLYAIWQHYPNNRTEIVLSKSTNSGINWTIPVIVNTGNMSYCSWMAIGPNGSTPGGSLYCGYNNYNGNLDSIPIIVRRTTDAGATFLNENVAATIRHPGESCFKIKNCSVQVSACIQMAADNSYGSYRGNLYIVYTAKTSSSDIADIYFIRSTNYGSTWSLPRKVNDDFTNTDQWLPAISVDNNTGKIFISWYDSRIDPMKNLQTKLYGTVSTDGGLNFNPNSPISTVSFNPKLMVLNGGYMGHYNGISSINNTSYAAWTDGRNNNFGSYTGYYPDFAMTVNPVTLNFGVNDSAYIVIKIPGVKGPFNDRIKFTASLDTLPTSGNIIYNFIGRDSINNIPDSIVLKIKTVGVTVPRLHRLFVKANATGNGVPVHWRTINLLVNSSFLTIGTNRNGQAQFKVNNILYNTQQQLPFVNGSNVTVQAVSPFNIDANKRYVYLIWSDAGDTTHNIIINSNTNVTAYYKTQFRFVLSSTVGNTFGGTNMYDSLQLHSFGVIARVVNYNGQLYRFRGWNGTGNGSYTSPDSTGNDTAVTVTLANPIVEIARWEQLIGIVRISNEIPKEYRLYQNYPNPFNPNTIFKIDIPKESFTKLTIYDILGQEVEILLTEKLQPGKYEIRWDGSGYSSGIYFYLFDAGDYKAVKRMVLMK